MPYRLIIPLIICLLFSSCSTTTYYLVRHADRLDESDQSPLSTAGHERAQALRDKLVDKGIDTIFASTYVRTQQTVQPLADSLGKTITVYSPDTTAGTIAALKLFRGKDIAFAGHSNTIPAIVEAMTGEVVTIPHEDYDNLFIVKIRRMIFSKKTWLIKDTYGEESP